MAGPETGPGPTGLLVGAGAIARLRYRESPPDYMHSFRWRLAGHLLFVALYWLLLLAVPVSAVFAAPGYVIGRTGAHVLVYAVG